MNPRPADIPSAKVPDWTSTSEAPAAPPNAPAKSAAPAADVAREAVFRFESRVAVCFVLLIASSNMRVALTL